MNEGEPRAARPAQSDVEPYVPPDCALHDELEAAATLLRLVDIIYMSDDGQEEVRNVRIVDVGARGGADYALLSSGLEVRLDRIVSMEVHYRPRDDAAHVE